MKRLLLFIAATLTLTAKSQTSVYHPFPDSNAYWNVGHQYLDGISDCYTFFLRGDTIINTLLYHKLYANGYEGGSNGICTNGGSFQNRYYGALRQNIALKKEYFVFPDSSVEKLMYDFNVSTGDTIPSSCLCNGYIVVGGIDSILIGGSYRKQFGVGCYGSGCCAALFIEGIGSEYGLLLGPYDSFENVWQLQCFNQNGINLYGSSYTCDFISGNKELTANNFFSVHSNPFYSKLYIRTSINEETEVYIYDVLFRSILHQTFINSTTLDTERLTSGLYIYELRNKTGVIEKGKLIKQQ